MKVTIIEGVLYAKTPLPGVLWVSWTNSAWDPWATTGNVWVTQRLG